MKKETQYKFKPVPSVTPDDVKCLKIHPSLRKVEEITSEERHALSVKKQAAWEAGHWQYSKMRLANMREPRK